MSWWIYVGFGKFMFSSLFANLQLSSLVFCGRGFSTYPDFYPKEFGHPLPPLYTSWSACGMPRDLRQVSATEETSEGSIGQWTILVGAAFCILHFRPEVRLEHLDKHSSPTISTLFGIPLDVKDEDENVQSPITLNGIAWLNRSLALQSDTFITIWENCCPPALAISAVRIQPPQVYSEILMTGYGDSVTENFSGRNLVDTGLQM
jgi:hypothetical protein